MGDDGKSFLFWIHLVVSDDDDDASFGLARQPPGTSAWIGLLRLYF